MLALLELKVSTLTRDRAPDFSLGAWVPAMAVTRVRNGPQGGGRWGTRGHFTMVKAHKIGLSGGSKIQYGGIENIPEQCGMNSIVMIPFGLHEIVPKASEGVHWREREPRGRPVVPPCRLRTRKSTVGCAFHVWEWYSAVVRECGLLLGVV